MKRIFRYFIRWRLRRAQEQLAALNAEREALEASGVRCAMIYNRHQYVSCVRNQAKLEERVEQLMRE